ncbi:MAG: hypothetical protein U0792_13860 [Gemmataceae bacterium]
MRFQGPDHIHGGQAIDAAGHRSNRLGPAEAMASMMPSSWHVASISRLYAPVSFGGMQTMICSTPAAWAELHGHEQRRDCAAAPPGQYTPTRSGGRYRSCFVAFGNPHHGIAMQHAD